MNAALLCILLVALQQGDPPPLFHEASAHASRPSGSKLQDLSDDLAQLVARVVPAVVGLRVSLPGSEVLPADHPPVAQGEYVTASEGSGFLISEAGYVLTCDHVVSPPRPAVATSEPRVEAELHDGRKLTAKIVGRDFLGDLALLKLEGESPFPYLELGEAKNVQVGEILIAVGNPFGVLANSVSLGILSGRGRQLMQGQMFGGLLQTDATIHPGNSGGPLLNVRGEVVAVSNAKITGAGLGFAIPIDEAKRVLPELLSSGSPARGYLGLSFEDESASSEGTVIGMVQPESPADRAGLKKGDIITTVLGNKVHSLQDVTNLVGARRPGERIEITFLRDGKGQSLEVVLGRRPR